MTTTARWESIHSPYGIASLRHTHWLDAEPREYDGAPGLWRVDGSTVVGTGIPERGEIRLAAFEETTHGDLLLRAYDRDGALALRVYDPDNPSRTALRGIAEHPHDDAWIIPGVFTAADAGAELVVRAVDGYESTEAAGGTVAVTIDGAPVELVVLPHGDGIRAVISDATAQDGDYRFRFLPIDAPAADGTVTVDFNRAHLPPCSFSDQYVCPLPPAQNRLPFRVTAGERHPIRD